MGTGPGHVGAQGVPRASAALHPGVGAPQAPGVSAATSHRVTWAPVCHLLGDP